MGVACWSHGGCGVMIDMVGVACWSHGGCGVVIDMWVWHVGVMVGVACWSHGGCGVMIEMVGCGLVGASWWGGV